MSALMDDHLKIGFNYSEKQAYKNYLAVRKELQDEFQEIREHIASDLYAKLNNLYEKSLDKNNIRDARGCLMDIAKITGVDQGKSVKISKDEVEIRFE